MPVHCWLAIVYLSAPFGFVYQGTFGFPQRASDSSIAARFSRLSAYISARQTTPKPRANIEFLFPRAQIRRFAAMLKAKAVHRDRSSIGVHLASYPQKIGTLRLSAHKCSSIAVRFSRLSAYAFFVYHGTYCR